MLSKTKKNYLFQVFYGIMSMIIPLITAPYITRVLGAEELGVYNYAYSISGMFLKVAELGVINHGSRSIAILQGNKKERSRTFSEIYFIQAISGVIISLIYLFYVFLFVKENTLIAFLQILYVSSSIFNVRWFYMGLEDFKKTVTRDMVVKIISFVSIFVFVRGKDDLWKYTIITLGSFLFSNIFLWIGIHKYIDWIRPSIPGIKKQLKPMIVLFIPTIAVTIYTVMDKMMLGIISGSVYVAYYHYAAIIVAIPLFFITSFGQVMLPRLSVMTAEGDKRSKNIVHKSLIFAFFMACAFSFGLSSISSTFIPLYYGEEFEASIILLILISMKLPFMAYSDVLRSQVLIPNHVDKKYVISLFIGAGINLAVNFMLIPKMAAIGAAIGTIVAEAAVCIAQIVYSRPFFNPKETILKSIPFIAFGMIMLIVVTKVGTIRVSSELIKLLIQILSGAVIYLILSFIYYCVFVIRENPYITIKIIINKLKKTQND